MKYTKKKKVKAKKYNKLVNKYNQLDQLCKDLKEEIAVMRNDYEVSKRMGTAADFEKFKNIFMEQK